MSSPLPGNVGCGCKTGYRFFGTASTPTLRVSGETPAPSENYQTNSPTLKGGNEKSESPELQRVVLRSH